MRPAAIGAAMRPAAIGAAIRPAAICAVNCKTDQFKGGRMHTGYSAVT